MTFADIGAIGTAVLALPVIALVVWKPVKAAARFFRTQAQMARAVHGEPADPARPGSGTPGLLSRVDAIGVQGVATAAAVAVIQHEVEHNGGGSIKDAVKRLETATTSISGRLAGADQARLDQTTELKADIAILAARLDRHIDNNPTR